MTEIKQGSIYWIVSADLNKEGSFMPLCVSACAPWDNHSHKMRLVDSGYYICVENDKIFNSRDEAMSKIKKYDR